MPRPLQLVYWDSCVFLYYINDDPVRLPIITAILLEAQRQTSIRIVTSVVSMAEVAYAASEQAGKPLDSEQEKRIDALWSDRSVVEIVEFHEILARDARSLLRRARQMNLGMRPYDAIHLATALRLRVSELQTYDKPLMRFDGVFGIPVVEPHSI